MTRTKPTTSKRKVADEPKRPAKLVARLLRDEKQRRENAAAHIRSAAETAGMQKARIGVFMGRLQARMDRAAERVEKLVADERERQARALEKYPELKQLNGQPSLDDAAAIPDIAIPESELPAYITSIAQ